MKIVKEMIGTVLLSGVVYAVLILLVILCALIALVEVSLKQLMSWITLLNAKMMKACDWIVETCSRYATGATTSRLWKKSIVVEDFLNSLRKRLSLKKLV